MSFEDRRRHFLRQVASETVGAARAGGFTTRNKVHKLHTTEAKRDAQYIPPNDVRLTNWPVPPDKPPSSNRQPTWFSIHEISTLEGIFLLSNVLRNNNANNNNNNGGSGFSLLRRRSTVIRSDNDKIGVLNFANATKPGGGFFNGSQAQEESIARSSTLYPTLTTKETATFYNLHNRIQNPFYTHAMIYSPGVEVFRDDDGGWMWPVTIDVLTSAAVNAKEVRQQIPGRWRDPQTELSIALMMRERMARVLCLFESRGVRNLVLGSFGTGVFQNDVGLVARIWADLLAVEGARFQHSFDRVVFAIVGNPTFVEFANVFHHSRSE